jgi:hypothetical protein
MTGELKHKVDRLRDGFRFLGGVQAKLRTNGVRQAPGTRTPRQPRSRDEFREPPPSLILRRTNPEGGIDDGL